MAWYPTNTETGSQRYHVRGQIAKNYNASLQSTTWCGTGQATVCLHDDHTCEVYFDYTVNVNDDAVAGYQFGLSVSAMKALNSNIPTITPQIGGYLIIVNPDGTIRPETSTSGTASTANGYGAFNSASSNYPDIWLTSRVYKTDGSQGSWSSSSIPKFSRLYGVAIGIW